MTPKQVWDKIHEDEAEHKAAIAMASKKENAPVVGAIRDAWRKFYATPLGQLQRLFDEESRWRRKQTIATNKLAETRERIYKLATELANEASEPTPPEQGKTLMQLLKQGKL